MNDEPASQTYFLSYSRADQDFALRFAQDLRASGVTLWVDQLDIRPSEHWDRAIERAVRDCRGLVVILSPSSAASDNVADEISFAIDHGKTVLPVMIERCRLPLRIARMQLIDATADYRRALQQCIDAISSGGPRLQQIEVPETQSGVTDQDAIISAKRELTAILGPIASILVDKEAHQARSVADLYKRLAEHIPDDRNRERFAKHAPVIAAAPSVPKATASPRPKSPMDKGDVDRATSILTHYLGPIAQVVARRESAAAISPQDLEERLACRIPDERERADFLKRIRKH